MENIFNRSPSGKGFKTSLTYLPFSSLSSNALHKMVRRLPSRIGGGLRKLISSSGRQHLLAARYHFAGHHKNGAHR